LGHVTLPSAIAAVLSYEIAQAALRIQPHFKRTPDFIGALRLHLAREQRK
jgi:hypothetical protein